MIKRLLVILLLPLTVSFAMGQNAGDALRFSTFNVGGTARFLGTGGSLSALGTEFSVLSTNPAGLAMYRKSEVVITPSFQLTNATSVLEGSFFPGEEDYLPQDRLNDPNTESKGAFTLNNLGFVVHSQPREFAFKTMNFGIGFNQLSNFNQEFFYEGTTIGSITERWQELANNFGLDDFEAGTAYDGYALYDIEEDGRFETDYETTYDQNFVGAPLLRNQRVSSRGSMSELVFGLATNYQERVMFGLSIGVPFINYRLTKEYREIDNGPAPNGNVSFFDDLSFEENLTTTGAGINAKLGLIFRLHQAFRLGLAVHTPTAFSLDDEYSVAVGYNFTDADGPFSGFSESDEGLFDYRLRTPWRVFGSAGVVIQKFGFLTAEVEWVNYNNAKFRYEGFQQDEDAVNEDIQQSLNQALNIRLGGELAYDIFRFRAGVNLLPSPYDGVSDTYLGYSAGAGIRTESFFIDLAWRSRQQLQGFVPYGSFEVPQQFVNNEFNYHDFVLSVGVRY